MKLVNNLFCHLSLISVGPDDNSFAWLNFSIVSEKNLFFILVEIKNGDQSTRERICFSRKFLIWK